MSTSALIIIDKPDGKVESIYCHYDGSPTVLGKTLKNYNSYMLANDLIGLGDIRYLLPSIDEMEDDPRALFHVAPTIHKNIDDAVGSEHTNYYYHYKTKPAGQEGWYCRSNSSRVWSKLH